MSRDKPEYGQRYREKNREKERERCRRYRAAKKAAKVRDPVKEYARGVVRDLIFRKKITKPEHCPRCGEKKLVQAHHHDYNKPLEIEWLCHLCHSQEHRKHVVG